MKHLLSLKKTKEQKLHCQHFIISVQFQLCCVMLVLHCFPLCLSELCPLLTPPLKEMTSLYVYLDPGPL